MLELIDVCKSYKGTKAVDHLSFSLPSGEAMGLIGANGAGKSTTISMIATLVVPDSGTILYRGQDIVRHPDIMRHHIGYVPQDIALYPSLSGWDNLKFWGRANHVYGSKLKERIRAAADAVCLSSDILKKKVGSYSGGMKRKLNIGAALIHEPELIILDEPTVGLDLDSRNQILDTVVSLRRQGVGIIYVSHYLEEVERICSKICVMNQGKAVHFTDMSDIQSSGLNLEQLWHSNKADSYVR